MRFSVYLAVLILSAVCSTRTYAQDMLESIFDCSEEDCLLASDTPFLSSLKNQSLGDDWTYSIGGALRYPYLDKRNRLRPPLRAGRSSYDQYRFTPFVQMKYKDLATVHIEAIDAPTFGNDLPQVIIDENRSDLLQAYIDLNLMEIGDGELHFKYGRQFLKYGSQHLISPLAWANTYRNFEGYKLYYTSNTWDIDGFAVQPVNGATGNTFRPTSFDTPDQSRWFSGVYASYKQAPGGVLDLYWLWVRDDDDRLVLVDGNRHTIGSRYAGKKAFTDESGDSIWVMNWDVEGGYQFGTSNFVTGLDQDVQAGYLSAQVGPTLSTLPWTPTITGIFWYGSGDNDPTDGTLTTNDTLFPLGHAYWGQIDNLNGQNLLDYGVHVTVKPTKKLSFLTGFHWFDKAAANDAIYNIAGVPFGGVTTTDRHIGSELDLVATYQVNKNLQLQAGYFWFWYGDAVTQNPNALVRNRGDADQVYFYADWSF
ncbi:MAG: alginate export family protein [Planctomycetaceae bacterium]|nr:alginate export family protein [Planctomycetaceae bacterium]